LEQYCIGERNIVHESYKFNTRCQSHEENVDAFYSELRALADKCGFNFRPATNEAPAPFDEMLGDRIVLGIRDDSLRKKLISQGNTVTLDQAVRICRSSEVTSTVMQSVTKGASSGSVDAINKAQSSYPKYKQSKPSHTHKQGGAV